MKRLFTLLVGLSCISLYGMDDKPNLPDGTQGYKNQFTDGRSFGELNIPDQPTQYFVGGSDGSVEYSTPVERIPSPLMREWDNHFDAFSNAPFSTISSSSPSAPSSTADSSFASTFSDASDIIQNIHDQREWINQEPSSGLVLATATSQLKKNSPAKNLNDYKKLVSNSIAQIQEHINKAKVEIKNFQNQLHPIRNKQRQVKLALDSIRGRKSHSGRVPLGKQFGELGSKIKGLEQQVNNKTQLIKYLENQIKQQHERIAKLNHPIPNYVYADIKKAWDLFCTREKNMQVAEKAYSKNQNKLKQLRSDELKISKEISKYAGYGSRGDNPLDDFLRMSYGLGKKQIAEIVNPYKKAQNEYNQARQQLEKAQYPPTLHNELAAYQALTQQEVTNNPADVDAKNKLKAINHTITQKGKTSAYKKNLSAGTQTFIKKYGKDPKLFTPAIGNPLQVYFYNKINGQLDQGVGLYAQYSSRKTQIDANLDEGANPEFAFQGIVHCSEQAIKSTKSGEFYLADLLTNCTNMFIKGVSICLSDPVYAGWGLFKSATIRATYVAAFSTACSFLPASVGALIVPAIPWVAGALTIAGVVGVAVNYNEIQTWWSGLNQAQQAQAIGELVGSFIPLPFQASINAGVQKATRKSIDGLKNFFKRRIPGIRTTMFGRAITAAEGTMFYRKGKHQQFLVAANRAKSNLSDTKYPQLDINDPQGVQKIEWAENYYTTVRAQAGDVNRVSRNTGIPLEKIQHVKNHVFVEEHILHSGIQRFDSDYDIAKTWERLVNGTHAVQDVEWLCHEHLEALIMRGKTVPWRSAHDVVNVYHNWEHLIK